MLKNGDPDGRVGQIGKIGAKRVTCVTKGGVMGYTLHQNSAPDRVGMRGF